MKLFHINRLLLPAVVVAAIISGCSKPVDEYNPGGRTAETYYSTKQGFEDLVRSNYSTVRNVTGFNSLYFTGTDIFTSYATTDINFLNLYNASLNSALPDVDGFWKQLYYSIGIANTTLFWADKVQGMDAAVVQQRTGEARALRAWYYFLLAETFGDVPLVLKPSTEPVLAFVRTPEKDVYTQMVLDLTEAINSLPATTPDFGRATKGFAQHLLAKVYLARGGKTYGGGVADYTLAASTAEALINSNTYKLVNRYGDLFDPTINNFQVNSEVIFSVQFSNVVATNGGGNSLHQYFLWDTQIVPAIGRSSLYNKPNYAQVPTPYFFSLFDKKRDSRYLATVWNAVIAQTNAAPFATGDTVVYYPDEPWTAAQKAAVKYSVFNPDEYRKGLLNLTRSFPMFKKFRETSLTFNDGLGTRDSYVFRLGETYLIAAEAYLLANNAAKALSFFNAIRTRAAKPGNNPATGVSYAKEMEVASFTVDDILDERARELAGEEYRWFELKRTGKLVSRTLTYNEETKAVNTLNAQHVLRPIPQSQIDLNRGEFPQNQGYN